MAWFDELDEETQGHIKNRGLDKLEAPQAAAALVKSYREAEKKFGVPADRLVRIPDKPDDPGWDEVWGKLGAPKGADEYKFDGIKFSDGTDPSEALIGTVRQVALDLHLPVEAAGRLAQRVVAHLDQEKNQTTEKHKITAAAEARELDESWGESKEHNMFLARRAVEALNFPADTIEKIEGTVGYKKTMEAFRILGARMQEPSWLSGSGPAKKVYTREEALAQIAVLKGDKAWVDKWYNGDKDAKAELDDLHKIVAGVPIKR